MSINNCDISVAKSWDDFLLVFKISSTSLFVEDEGIVQLKLISVVE